MVKINFYGEIQEIEQIPESYYDFVQIIRILYSFRDEEKLTLEYKDNQKYIILNEETYNDFFLNGKKDLIVDIYPTYEETNTYKQENEIIEIKEEKEEKEELDEINTDSNKIKSNQEEGDSKEIKVPEITKDMVIASIVKQVKEKMQQSRLMLEKKEKEEEEERKRQEEEEKQNNKIVTDKINNLITNRLNNLREELINESQIKFSQVMTESQIQLKSKEKNNIKKDNSTKDINIIHSLEEHPGVSCSKCGMNPIIGNRYSCIYCNNINYCEKCEEEDGFEHGHPFYEFKLRID